MKDEDVGYLTDPVPLYVDAIHDAENLEQLKTAVHKFEFMAEDAVCVVDGMTEQDWPKFLEAHIQAKKENGDHANPEHQHFWPILMPALMMRIGTMAVEFKAPWGCTYIRAKQLGSVVLENGIAKWRDKT